MDLTQIIKIVTDAGFGIASFAALLFGGWKILAWLEDVKGNHLVHIQNALTNISKNTLEANVKLDEQNGLLQQIHQNTNK